MRKLLLLLPLAACWHATEPQDLGPTGHYHLASIAGHALPISTNLGFSYQKGSLELRDDSSFVDVIQIAGIVDSVKGSFHVDADSIRFIPVNWSKHYSGSWKGQTLEIMWAEGVFLYRRDR